jgi:hypothetical protein
MAGSMIQRRQDAERERIEIYEATLRRVARRPRLAPDFAKAIDEAARGFSSEVVRDAQSWQPQMKTRDAARLRLAAARRAMRHCVSTYAGKCIAGHASIWSLRRCTKAGIDRLLTIEVDPQRRAVQVRGFANRLAHADERNVLERWAKARGITLR